MRKSGIHGYQSSDFSKNQSCSLSLVRVFRVFRANLSGCWDVWNQDTRPESLGNWDSWSFAQKEDPWKKAPVFFWWKKIPSWRFEDDMNAMLLFFSNFSVAPMKHGRTTSEIHVFQRFQLFRGHKAWKATVSGPTAHWSELANWAKFQSRFWFSKDSTTFAGFEGTQKRHQIAVPGSFPKILLVIWPSTLCIRNSSIFYMDISHHSRKTKQQQQQQNNKNKTTKHHQKKQKTSGAFGSPTASSARMLFSSVTGRAWPGSSGSKWRSSWTKHTGTSMGIFHVKMSTFFQNDLMMFGLEHVVLKFESLMLCFDELVLMNMVWFIRTNATPQMQPKTTGSSNAKPLESRTTTPHPAAWWRHVHRAPFLERCFGNFFGSRDGFVFCAAPGSGFMIQLGLTKQILFLPFKTNHFYWNRSAHWRVKNGVFSGVRIF